MRMAVALVECRGDLSLVLSAQWIQRPGTLIHAVAEVLNHDVLSNTPADSMLDSGRRSYTRMGSGRPIIVGSRYCVDRFMLENAKDSGNKRVDSRPKHEDGTAQLARMNALSVQF
jgi:hypothetical protein